MTTGPQDATVGRPDARRSLPAAERDRARLHPPRRDAASTGYDAAKRALDVIGASLALVALAPVIAGTAGLVALRLGRPVLFRQPRPGRDGRVFTLLKLRSMHEVDEATAMVTDEQRLTAFGRALRASSLDELPSLVNVLRGDMSIVGPRPLLVEYLQRYSREQARRHEVRPGITGLAQVRGRVDVDWETGLGLDVQYVDARSLRLDARIVLETVGVVLRRAGVTTAPTTMRGTFAGSASSASGGHDAPDRAADDGAGER